MKTYCNIVTLLLIILVIGSVPVQGKDAGAYLSSVRIAITTGDEDRYQEALEYLDTIAIHFGPVAEAIYWRSKLYIDFMDKRSDLKDKLGYAEKFVTYRDSLHQCCENQDIKKKYRKKCEDYRSEIDSTGSYLWKIFYNNAVAQIKELDRLNNDLAEAVDSSEKDYYVTRLAAQTDSCKDNMLLAILMDSTDARTYMGLATVYEKNKNYEESKKYLLQALNKTKDRTTVLLQLAYNYIYTNDYCGAIPYFREYVDTLSQMEEFMSDPFNVESVAATMQNLGICYNNCEMYDSAYVLHLRLLALTPDNAEVQTAAGRYHNQMGRYAADSINYFKEKANEAEAKKWEDIRNLHFDSSLVFLKKSYKLQPDNAEAAEEYGVIAAIREDFEAAKTAFARVSELRPDDKENWTSLGDCNLRLKDFKGAAEAYEKVIELDPDNKDVIESLVGIYTELGNKAKASELRKKL